MREPLNFTTNAIFIENLFHSGELANWHIRYFDPTQVFLHDRVQKGLLECLMIKRAKLCVYNAQESDTFGKDAEAGVTLAQGKPVIVYVARFGEKLESLKPLYQALDSIEQKSQKDSANYLSGIGLISAEKVESLKTPPKTKSDIIKEAVKVGGEKALKELGDDKIKVELLQLGYEIGPQQDIKDYALKFITNLERRALIFRENHPLSLQTSPMDGVARGVLVSRSVEDTASVIKGILLGNLHYKIVSDAYNWLLREEITNSPVRVVTKDPFLTTAFWSADWRI
jgi:hypothetical protein